MSPRKEERRQLLRSAAQKTARRRALGNASCRSRTACLRKTPVASLLLKMFTNMEDKKDSMSDDDGAIVFEGRNRRLKPQSLALQRYLSPSNEDYVSLHPSLTLDTSPLVSNSRHAKFITLSNVNHINSFLRRPTITSSLTLCKLLLSLTLLDLQNLQGWRVLLLSHDWFKLPLCRWQALYHNGRTLH